MTNHPEAALRALELTWRNRAALRAGTCLDLYATCADELAAILRQLEVAPRGTDIRLSFATNFLSGWLEDEGEEVLRHWQVVRSAIEAPAAPSPPDSSQGEPVAWKDAREQKLAEHFTPIAVADVEPWMGMADSALRDARKAVAVLFTMLTKIGQREGAMVADEIGASIETALKEIAHVRCGAIAAPQSAPKAAEPTIEIWRLAIFHWATDGAEGTDSGPLYVTDLIEQRARSLAQAEQAAKGEE